MVVFDIDGKCLKSNNINGTIFFKEMELYVNIPEWIDERTIYDVNSKKPIGYIKPKKFNGLSYSIFEIIDDFVRVKTVNFGMVLIKMTESLTISNKPLYRNGWYE